MGVFNGYLSSRGWSAEALATMAYASVWIWYLNRYRLKGGSTPLPPSTLNPSLANSVEETPANDAAVAMSAEEAHPDIYAEELELFEAGDVDQSLWAKHIVETEGDSEKAKWKYIKERVATAPARRLDEQRLAERKVEANIRAIHQARVDSYMEKSKLGGHRNPAEWVGS